MELEVGRWPEKGGLQTNWIGTRITQVFPQMKARVRVTEEQFENQHF